MKKGMVAVVGLLILLASLLLNLNIEKNEKLAASLDENKTGFGIIGGDSLPACSWQVNGPERIMSENKSQAIVIQVTNQVDKDCELYLSLRAPGFDISPAKEEQKITLAIKGRGSLSWILTPRKTGSYEIALSDILNTKIIGITVKNMFGLSGTQAKVFSTIGSLFGPMFTIPWWLDKWLQRRKKREENVSLLFKLGKK